MPALQALLRAGHAGVRPRRLIDLLPGDLRQRRVPPRVAPELLRRRRRALPVPLRLRRQRLLRRRHGRRDAHLRRVGGIAFGCGVDNGGLSYNSTGTVGLGRGSLSLVAQLGVGKFSYCLTDFFNTSLASPALFGSLAELAPGAAAAAQSTPLVQNPRFPSWYFVSLEGISLGATRLPIPNGTFDLRADGSGGMIVDSGTIFTVLVESAFRAVVGGAQPVANTSSLDGPCFPAPPGAARLPEMPDMVLHFAGGADMRLRRDNYMSFNREAAAFCLDIVGTVSSVSVLGNFQ